MKTLIWSLTALLAALWTGCVALLHKVSGWLLTAIDTGTLSGAAGSVGQLPLPSLPAWVAPWFDADALATLRLMGVDLLQWLGAVLPSGDALMGWIGPLLWLGWALGLLALLAVAGLLHWLVGRRMPAPAVLRGAGA